MQILNDHINDYQESISVLLFCQKYNGYVFGVFERNPRLPLNTLLERYEYSSITMSKFDIFIEFIDFFIGYTSAVVFYFYQNSLILETH
jgi:hypothetical protein